MFRAENYIDRFQRSSEKTHTDMRTRIQPAGAGVKAHQEVERLDQHNNGRHGKRRRSLRLTVETRPPVLQPWAMFPRSIPIRGHSPLLQADTTSLPQSQTMVPAQIISTTQ
jgi:hypothetical protein